MEVAFRADGGPEIGYGHLVRSGTLAERLETAGHAVTLATRTPSAGADAYPSGADVQPLSGDDPERAFVRWVERASPDVVVTDCYEVDTDCQRRVRDSASLVVFLDDARHTVCADVLVNGNVYAPSLDHAWIGPDPVLCLGPAYLVLRSDVAALAADSPRFRESPERALVTMGGSDPNDATPQVLKGFDGLEVTVDVAVGPGFSCEPEIRSVAANVDAEVSVHVDPSNLPQLMFEADCAATAMGTTTYELLSLGTPFVGLPQADNQQLIATAVDERNLGIVLDGDAGSETINRALRRLVTDAGLRRDLQRRGRDAVDANGTDRVCEAIRTVVPDQVL